MATDCLFCKIIAGQIPSKKVYEDAQVYAFEDIHPQAPTHVLVLPRRHIPTTSDIKAEDETLVGHLTTVAAKIAKDRGHADSGFRMVFNTNRDAGQSVFHIHLHLLGGRPMEWPPG